jgi:hypothetical protein
MPQTAPTHRDLGAGAGPSSSEHLAMVAVKLADLLRLLAHWIEPRRRPAASGRSRSPRPLATAFPSLVLRIESFERLPERWNGHQAGPIEKQVRHEAIAFLGKLDANFGPHVPEPSAVDPTSDGGVAVEWKVAEPPTLVQVMLLPSGANEYTIRDLTTDRLVRGAEDVADDVLLDLVKTSVVNHQLSLE